VKRATNNLSIIRGLSSHLRQLTDNNQLTVLGFSDCHYLVGGGQTSDQQVGYESHNKPCGTGYDNRHLQLRQYAPYHTCSPL